MEINKKIRQKAHGIMKSIETMSESEKKKLPSMDFGENYNRLRAAVIENNNDLVSLVPPDVKFNDYGYEDHTDIKTTHRYSEIHTFCSEIYYLLE